MRRAVSGRKNHRDSWIEQGPPCWDCGGDDD